MYYNIRWIVPVWKYWISLRYLQHRSRYKKRGKHGVTTLTWINFFGKWSFNLSSKKEPIPLPVPPAIEWHNTKPMNISTSVSLITIDCFDSRNLPMNHFHLPLYLSFPLHDLHAQNLAYVQMPNYYLWKQLSYIRRLHVGIISYNLLHRHLWQWRSSLGYINLDM